MGHGKIKPSRQECPCDCPVVAVVYFRSLLSLASKTGAYE